MLVQLEARANVFWNPGAVRHVRLLLTMLICVAVLSACGNESASKSTPTASPTPVLVLPPSAAGTSTALPIAGSAVPGQLTVGEIADRIAAAWAGVKSYRSTFSTAGMSIVASPVPSPMASPVAALTTTMLVDDVILPDRRHRSELRDGMVVSELILVGGAVYERGVQFPDATPVADPRAWMKLDPATIPSDSPYRAVYDAMTAPLTPPYSGLSPDERERIAHPIGQVAVGGRMCAGYRVADTTMTGERIEVVIAIGEDDLPCSIETTVGGTVSTTTFEFEIPLTIEPPI
jgi:hypothetical protein